MPAREYHLFRKSKINIVLNPKDGYCPYHIGYIHITKDGWDLTIYKENSEDNNQDNKAKIVKKALEEIGEIVREYYKKSSNEFKKDIKLLLEQIRYLFKSVDYRYEEEARLLVSVPESVEKDRIEIDDKPTVPQLYIERKDEPLKYKKVILGPKVSEPDKVTPYIKYCDKEIAVTKSDIKYR